MASWSLININKSLLNWKIPDNYLKIKCGISLFVNKNNQQNQNNEFDLIDLDNIFKSDLDSKLNNTPVGIWQAV